MRVTVLLISLFYIATAGTVAQDTANHTALKTAWIKFTPYDSLYSVEVPGKPVVHELGESLHMRGYFDSTAGKGYFSSVINTYQEIGDRDGMIKELVKRMSSQRKELTGVKIEKQGLKGRDVTFRLKGMYVRANIYVAKRLVFIVMVAAKHISDLTDSDSNHFLTSLDIKALSRGFMP